MTARQLTFDDVQPEAHGAQEEAIPDPDLPEVAAALKEVRAHLGYKTWQDAWSAYVGGYKQDGDPRIVRGTANLAMLAALLDDDPLAEGSLLCYLAEIGAEQLVKHALIELVEQERKEGRR